MKKKMVKFVIKGGIKAAVVCAAGAAIYAVKTEKDKVKRLEALCEEQRRALKSQHEIIRKIQKFQGVEVDPE